MRSCRYLQPITIEPDICLCERGLSCTTFNLGACNSIGTVMFHLRSRPLSQPSQHQQQQQQQQMMAPPPPEAAAAQGLSAPPMTPATPPSQGSVTPDNDGLPYLVELNPGYHHHYIILVLVIASLLLLMYHYYCLHIVSLLYQYSYNCALF